jgi:transposase
MRKDIILAVDYHDENIVVRRFNAATGEESVLHRETRASAVRQLVESAVAQLPVGGDVVWIMESTTGWARVKEIVEKAGGRFLLANVLQMPLVPKAHRRKTDKVDTARLLREYLNGTLPLAFQPDPWLRRVRRVTTLRENLVSRRTALTNYIDRYLAQESWEDRDALRAEPSRQRTFLLDGPDGLVMTTKLAELDHIEALLPTVEAEIRRIGDGWLEAQWVDEIRGIGVIAAVSILARIGPVERFPGAEELIAYAGLAPGVQRSDQTVRMGRIGGGGTDKRLRHYLIEATVWARQIPRYRRVYERVALKRGNKIARLVVARHLLRSVYRMLKDRVRFDQLPAA